jgi:hypothetical protein
MDDENTNTTPASDAGTPAEGGETPAGDAPAGDQPAA